MLRVERTGAIEWITLDRPEKLNALSAELLRRLDEVLAKAAEDNTIRAVGIRGSGRCFSVGADVADFEQLDTSKARRGYLQGVLAHMRAVADLPIPTVACVHGLALGGGCELAMSCDIVVAAADAEFGLPEVTLGVLPAVAIVIGRHRVPPGQLARLALTGSRVSAGEAQRLGLVDVIPELRSAEEEAELILTRIAQNAPLAVRSVKRLLREGADYAAAADAAALLLESDDHRVGVVALRSRESPTFEGR